MNLWASAISVENTGVSFNEGMLAFGGDSSSFCSTALHIAACLRFLNSYPVNPVAPQPLQKSKVHQLAFLVCKHNKKEVLCYFDNCAIKDMCKMLHEPVDTSSQRF